MGCAQATPTVTPSNHIPIERVFVNEDCTLLTVPPVVMITADPTPPYIKSVLKKGYLDGKGKTEKLSILHRKLPSINKTVNFDGQVLVRARTPTPNKIWYEKASSTMPKRKHPRNDDDDYDYDEEEIPSDLSDEEQENHNIQSQLPHSNFSNQWNESTNFWPDPDQTPDTMLENQTFLPIRQQSSHNMNGYTTENTMSPPINRIKVRRRLSPSGPPQIVPFPVYSSPLQPTTAISNRFYPQIPATPTYRIPTQSSTVYPLQSSPQTFQVPKPLSNTNSVLMEQQTLVTNGESSFPTPYPKFNPQPLQNVP